MTIPYVRTGEKLHLSANTLNTIADHINNAPSISAGKPIKGGGSGVPVVQDNTADIFKIKNGGQSEQGIAQIDVSGGYAINGVVSIYCSGVVLTLPTSDTRYVVFNLSYSNGSYSSSISLYSSPQYPTYEGAGFSLTLGKVITQGNIISSIEQWHYPNHIFISNRWS